MKPVESYQLFVGALVIWLHSPRGGYGYQIPVPAKVAKLSLDGERVTIEVQTKSGATVRRNVRAGSLRWKGGAL